MKQKPRIPEGNKTTGPRCSRCGAWGGGVILVPNYLGEKICRECSLAVNAKYAPQHPTPQRSSHNLGMATDTAAKEPWHLANNAATGGLSADGAYLNHALKEMDQRLSMAFRQVDAMLSNIHEYMEERTKQLEAAITEQSETIKDLIEELSE